MPGQQIGLDFAATLLMNTYAEWLCFTPLIDVLAVACLASWLREWRHDEQGRVFFTLLTAVALLLAVGLSADVSAGSPEAEMGPFQRSAGVREDDQF